MLRFLEPAPAEELRSYCMGDITTLSTDNMGDTNGNGNTVSENDSMLDNAGNAVDEAGDTVGNIVDDAANGISDITNDLVGNDNATTGTDQR